MSNSRYLSADERRLAVVCDVLAEHGPLSAYEIAERLPWSTRHEFPRDVVGTIVRVGRLGAATGRIQIERGAGVRLHPLGGRFPNRYRLAAARPRVTDPDEIEVVGDWPWDG